MPINSIMHWETRWHLAVPVLMIVLGALFFVCSFESFDYTADFGMLEPMAAVITSPGSNVSIMARTAAFGPPIPTCPMSDDDDQLGGFTGSLSVVQSMACDPEEFVEDLREKIALVMRGGCGFYHKVMTLQTWGAAAVIVGDNVYRRSLVTMFNREDTDDSIIPSVFVSKESYQILTKADIVTINSIPESSAFLDTVLCLLVSPLVSLTMIYAILVLHRRYRVMKERLPKSYIEHIPRRIWTSPSSESISQMGTSPAESSSGPGLHYPREKAWVSSGECIICLDDYVTGVSEVMRLPCGHEFHTLCITRWLVCRKKTCPICKKDVTQATEQTPLIQRLMHRGCGGVASASTQTET